MPKFTLIAEHTDLEGNPDGTKVTYECYGDYLPEILEHFDLFIRGCGFMPDGTLDYVPQEVYSHKETELYDSHEVLGKSPQYFDTERNK